MQLNPKQQEAVECTTGPLLVIAGAGAGKTRVLTHRILHLIDQGVPPQAILAITFTNKAAREMKERLRALLPETTPVPLMCTFHALGVRILREHGEEVGISRRFSIYDRSDSLRRIKQSMKDADISTERWDPKKILGSISNKKGEGMSSDVFADTIQGPWESITAEVWQRYDRYLKEDNALDFDDLLLKPMVLLRKNEDIRNTYQSRFDYLHIDEYQDTNGVQYELSRLLVHPKKNNICVVGDSDQTIYTWRGANMSNILEFEKDFPGCKTVLLEHNYRSTQNILHAANDVIKHNSLRKEKTLVTDNAEGEKISVVSGLDEESEARAVVRIAQEQIENGVSPSEIAVLYRTNFQSRTLEQAFLSAGVPYQVLGTRFFDRKEVKDLLAYLRAGLNPDSWVDIERIINTPRRGIGKKTLERIRTNKKDELSASRRRSVDDFFALLERINTAAAEKVPSELVSFVIKESGLEEDLKKDNETGRIENIHELVTYALAYDELGPGRGLEVMLENAALASDQDTLEETRDAVRLMTVHASKGLEFDVVIITGLEEGLFPQDRDSATQEEQEEERRLFYVALTRARKRIFLTMAEARTIFGTRSYNIPSRFIADIDDSLLEHDDDAVEWGSGDSGVEFLDLNDL